MDKCKPLVHGAIDELAVWTGSGVTGVVVPAAVTDGGYRAVDPGSLLARWRFDDRAAIGTASYPSPAPAAFAVTGPAAPTAVSSSFPAGPH